MAAETRALKSEGGRGRCRFMLLGGGVSFRAGLRERFAEIAVGEAVVAIVGRCWWCGGCWCLLIC